MSTQEQTIQAIQIYLESDMPHSALLFNGEWGVGKTHFWKHDIVSMLKRNSRPYVYVSLYAVKTHAEIEQQVVYGIFPFLDSKIARILKFVSEVKGIRVPPITYVPKLNKAVFCFDDLERSSLPASDVLGYINRFIEQYGMHVLILANELQITDSKYSTVKEKVVGKTFAMKPDIDLAMSNIWCSFKNKSKSLDNHRQSIEKTIKKCESVNLRSAIQAIDNCNLVLHFLEKLPSLKNEALDSLMVMTSAVTMESKLNGQLISLLRNLFASPHAVVFAAYLKREDETQDNNLEFLERFAARYFDGNIEKIPSLEAILNFVESGWIEIDLVHAQALALTTNVMPEKANLKQVFLRDIWSLNDQQVFEIAKSYIHEVNAGLITRVQLLAKVFASLMFISKHQVIAQTPTEILEQFLKAIEKLSLEDKFSESDIVNWDPQIVFYGQTGAEIVKFIEALNTARDIYIERRYQERLGSLFNEFDSDYEKFLQRMRGNRDEDHFDYEHKPVFARFDSKDFTDVILKKNAQDLRSFSQMLNQRYFRVVNIADFLKDEGIFLLKLASRLKEKLPSVAPGLKRIVIGRVIEQLEQASIKLCPQLASEEKAIDR